MSITNDCVTLFNKGLFLWSVAFACYNMGIYFEKRFMNPMKSHMKAFLMQHWILTSWYLDTPPLTAASMTPFRHMVRGLIFCICRVWHWPIRVFSCWFLFSNTSIAFSRGLISTWEANEQKQILNFVTFKKKDKVDYPCSELSALPSAPINMATTRGPPIEQTGCGSQDSYSLVRSEKPR